MRQSTTNRESKSQSSGSLGVWAAEPGPGITSHCSSCWTTRMINRSFRGISSNKNGTFPSLSIVSSIVYTTLVDLVNPGFEIFLAENLPFYYEVPPGAPGESQLHPGSRPTNGRTPGVWEFQKGTGVCTAGAGRPATYPQVIHRLSTVGVWGV